MRIVHVLRTPVGGIFRHVRDLISGQVARGCTVGLIVGVPAFETPQAASLEALRPLCGLGVHTLPIPHFPGLSDLSILLKARVLCREMAPDILHGHGSKGGLYARVVGKTLGVKTVYAPHGGSLHYRWAQPAGALYLGVEKLLTLVTDGFVFTCGHERDLFSQRIGISRPHVVAYNGVGEADFGPVALRDDACDFLFMGELRILKGLDLLLEALCVLRKDHPVRLAVVGDGPDRERFEAQVRALGLGDAVTFFGVLPAQEAFALGKVFVVPSRQESFPYVVLEALAAQKPILASRVGGIPEVLAEEALFAPEDHSALLARLRAALKASVPPSSAGPAWPVCRREEMVETVLSLYGTV